MTERQAHKALSEAITNYYGSSFTDQMEHIISRLALLVIATKSFGNQGDHYLCKINRAFENAEEWIEDLEQRYSN